MFFAYNQIINQIKIMKKLSLIFTVVAGLLISLNVKAQTNADYFPGKWNITVMGTPGGDSKMTFVLERKDGKLGGVVQDSTGKETSKITSIVEKDKTITAAFTLQAYDLTMALDPIDDDHVKGSLMGMFDAKGVRIKESK
jgi:hypothetical protein